MSSHSLGRIAHISALLIASFPGYAATAKDWQPGLSGDIAVMAGYSHTRSQFDTDNNITDSLDSQGQGRDSGIIFPLGTLKYTNQAGDKQVYMGSNQSDLIYGRFNLELGYKQRLQDNSVITIAYAPGLIASETWKDPFVTNVNREETDVNTKALRLIYDRILGTNFSFEFALREREIDNEESGLANFTPDEQALLRRDSDIYYSQLSYLHRINQDLALRGAASYTRTDADGDAMSNDRYGADITVIKNFERSNLAVTLHYDYSEYDKANPVFGKKQEDSLLAAYLAYRYAEPFGLKQWSFLGIAGYGYSDSKINFYENEGTVITAGLSYHF